MEAYQCGSVSLHLLLDSNLTLGPLRIFHRVVQFVNDTVRVYRTGVIEIFWSASDTLELEYRTISEVPRSDEVCGTVP